jgi:diguanylate cyclase (GGDEF)-like protein
LTVLSKLLLSIGINYLNWLNLNRLIEGGMQASESSNDDFLFIDDSDEDEILDDKGGSTWKVLIVDDDPEIHSVTQLALSDLVVLGKRLEYLHAYSGADACKIIEQQHDIVIVLLDVVMETDDAGLKVVRHIREQLNRHDIRIVLRTGQPGYAPEESVIKDYDINDYKTKTELTRRKLVTTVYAAIRSYQQIETVNRSREGLEKIVTASADLLELHTIHSYAEGVLSQLRNIIDNCKNLVFCARGQGIIDGVDDLSFYILGQVGLSAILVNQKLEALKHPGVCQQVLNCFQQKQHNYKQADICLYLASGGYRAVIYIELAEPAVELDQNLLEVFLSNVAIGYENVHLFHKLRDAAYKDWLTDLPNRLDFVHSLDAFVQADNDDVVAALVDINHFSDINDGLGQDVGNLLLSSVASRLSQLSPGIIVARTGADVFGLIGPSEVINPESLVALFTSPFKAGEQHLPVNACIGLCTKQHAGGQGVKVLNQINIALNLAKKNRQNFAQYYVQEMEDETQWRLDMIRQLRKDFSDNRLELWYQPQFNLATGKVVGAEALLRWRTAEGKFISPAVFIPLAEYSGLIVEIGDWVVHQACLQIKLLEQHQFNDVCISVNVSIPQFRGGNFVERVINKIQELNVSPNKMELEITENILMDEPQVVIDALVRLKAEGLKIALDDFGTGFSSMSYLQKLPLDRLKVDRSFIIDIASPGQSILADTIISLGKKMNLNVIAEGIEDEHQQAHLISQGCHDVQGFYYAKPMPSDQFIAFLQQNK